MRRVWLSLGSNLGSPWQQLSDAVAALRLSSEVMNLRCSAVFDTEPVGGPEQPNYLNLVVEFTTDESPEQLLQRCQELEAAAERVREERWGPRTLDVDIIGIEGVAMQTETLTIPHPRAASRGFVIAPLSQLVSPEAVLGAGAASDEPFTGIREIDRAEYPVGVCL